MPKREFLASFTLGKNERLDVFLAERIKELSRSLLQKAIEEGKVRVNNAVRKPSFRLREGDRVEIEYEILARKRVEPEDIPLEILYEDEQIVVVDKPSGMVVHPGAGVSSGTLVNALLSRYPDLKDVGPEERPGIVHRLDKETSGVMVVARTSAAQESLQQQFKEREVEKIYSGLVWGSMPRREGKIDWPIGRHQKYGERISVKTKKPRTAETYYWVRDEMAGFSLLEIKPVTGRTHQIRVHLAASGHPVVGDLRYGRKKSRGLCARLFLHSSRLAFFHPETGERVKFDSPLPEELSKTLGELRSGP